jgi:hypothetical protein
LLVTRDRSTLPRYESGKLSTLPRSAELAADHRARTN